MLTLAFAQTTTAGQGQIQQSPLLSFLPIIFIFVIFYFLLIRPQKKSQQEHAKLLEGLKKNDEVMTSGGIYGTIVNIQNDIVTLRVDEDVKIKIQKSYVARLKKA
ncbi:MAG: preprotein translocase subunit YajC [Candidatus Omnitrophota bacterium]